MADNDRDTLVDALMKADPLYPAVMARHLYENMADALRRHYRLIPWTDIVTETRRKEQYACQHDICVIHGSADHCPLEPGRTDG